MPLQKEVETSRLRQFLVQFLPQHVDKLYGLVSTGWSEDGNGSRLVDLYHALVTHVEADRKDEAKVSANQICESIKTLLKESSDEHLLLKVALHDFLSDQGINDCGDTAESEFERFMEEFGGDLERFNQDLKKRYNNACIDMTKLHGQARSNAHRRHMLEPPS